jgi:hypothetical protein
MTGHHKHRRAGMWGNMQGARLEGLVVSLPLGQEVHLCSKRERRSTLFFGSRGISACDLDTFGSPPIADALISASRMRREIFSCSSCAGFESDMFAP